MKEFSAKLLLQVIDLCNVNNLAVYAEYCGEWLHVNGVNSEIGVCINQKGYPMMGNPCYHGITGSPIVDYHGDGDKEPLIKKLDVYAEDFISNVEKGRGDKLLKPRSEWGTGKTYFADEALSIGLIDAIDTFDNVVNYFSNL